MTRSITAGIPAKLALWVSNTEAYSEVIFDDDKPAMNVRLLDPMAEHRAQIETSYGTQLTWRGIDANQLMTKRTKITAPKIAIGSKTEPSETALRELAGSARRLVDAVKPLLQEVMASAATHEG